MSPAHGLRHLGRAQSERGAGLGHLEPAALLEQTAGQLPERPLGTVALRVQVRRLHASVSPATPAGPDEQLRAALDQPVPAEAVAAHGERERSEHQAGLGHARVALRLHEARRVLEELGLARGSFGLLHAAQAADRVAELTGARSKPANARVFGVRLTRLGVQLREATARASLPQLATAQEQGFEVCGIDADRVGIDPARGLRARLAGS